MNRPNKLLPTVLAVPAILGCFVVGLTLFFPESPQSASVAEARQASVSPRIAAWQERIAEEKLYAEKAAIKDAAEKVADRAAFQQFREAHKLRAKALKAGPDEDRGQELARDRAKAKQKAAVAAQRSRQPEFDRAFGYAPEPNRSRFNNIYSAMREMRGGN